MTVGYEWDIETCRNLFEDGIEIIDHNHRDRLHDFGGEELTQALNQDFDSEDTFTRLVLVRTVDGGDRLWAYVTDDQKLPSVFSDSLGNETEVQVPKRFHTEFNL